MADIEAGKLETLRKASTIAACCRDDVAFDLACLIVRTDAQNNNLGSDSFLRAIGDFVKKYKAFDDACETLQNSLKKKRSSKTIEG